MPWFSTNYSQIIKEARDIIGDNFNIRPTAKVIICTEQEIYDATLNELISRNIPQKQIDFLKIFSLKLMIGKHFAATNEIWLVDGKGINLSTLVHEMIHSIQKCNPNRENIVDYVTYRILNGNIPNGNIPNGNIPNGNIPNGNIPNGNISIESGVLLEWYEIESQNTFSAIKKQVLQEKDCEDF
jgi:hypothetical protein